MDLTTKRNIDSHGLSVDSSQKNLNNPAWILQSVNTSNVLLNAQQAMSLELKHISDSERQKDKRMDQSSRDNSTTIAIRQNNNPTKSLPNVIHDKIKHQRNSYYPLTVKTHQIEQQTLNRFYKNSAEILPTLKIRSQSLERFKAYRSQEPSNISLRGKQFQSSKHDKLQK